MKAGAAGGIEVVVKAMNTHISNVGVCEQGCGALLNMAANDGKNYSKHRRIATNKQLGTK